MVASRNYKLSRVRCLGKEVAYACNDTLSTKYCANKIQSVKMQRRNISNPEMDEAADSPTNGGNMEYRNRAQSFIDSKALDELETEVFETGLYTVV